jgi:hypothetical protein
MNAYRSLVGKTEGTGPLGRPRCRWVDNIRMDLGEIGWGGMNWIGAVMNVVRLPLWSSGQSSWLQIRRPGFDSRHYQIFWKKKNKTVVGLE